MPYGKLQRQAEADHYVHGRHAILTQKGGTPESIQAEREVYAANLSSKQTESGGDEREEASGSDEHGRRASGLRGGSGLHVSIDWS